MGGVRGANAIDLWHHNELHRNFLFNDRTIPIAGVARLDTWHLYRYQPVLQMHKYVNDFGRIADSAVAKLNPKQIGYFAVSHSPRDQPITIRNFVPSKYFIWSCRRKRRGIFTLDIYEPKNVCLLLDTPRIYYSRY